jgi:outer membrane protein
MSLREALETALTQNPDLALARLDERKAQQDVQVARDPFAPRIMVGSGLAYNNGFPLSIEGSAPSAFRAQASQFLFNRQQSYTVAKAKENAHGAAIATDEKRDEVAYRVASRFVDGKLAIKQLETARRQTDSLEKVAQAVAARVTEGRELQVDSKRALLNVARARQRVASLEASLLDAELDLAAALGMEEGDRVEPIEDLQEIPAIPISEEDAVERALTASKELKKSQSDLLAEALDIKAQKAARLPRVDLVAEYGLFTRYNNYDSYFQTFQRHNGLIRRCRR